MAGIERCIDLVNEQGKMLFGELVKLRQHFIDQTSQLRHLSIADTHDPCKLIIQIEPDSNMTGKQLSRIMHEKYQLEMEMAAANYVIAIITIMDKPEGFDRLAQALGEIDKQLVAQASVDARRILTKQHQPETITPIHRAYDGEIKELPFEDAVGCIAAEFVIPYPPGMPLLVPGEKIDSHIIDLIKNYQNHELTLTGLSEMGTLLVLNRS
jgi:arginine/lysine/ornithine decarboxylase